MNTLAPAAELQALEKLREEEVTDRLVAICDEHLTRKPSFAKRSFGSAALGPGLNSEVCLDCRTARGCSIRNVATAQAPPGFQLTG